ncbi:MAG: tRNA lysidine(34) synthetase TilS [Deltaproteobacteria bacterium]|nr:tRNA lysidine(34) synthetase TilS [Deltaproteobacteria bacterium]
MKDYPNNLSDIHLFQSAKKTISAFGMIQKGDAILVGVSGGPDSVALLHTLRFLAPDVSFTLGIAHLNHCLRGNDSDDDARFVLSLCEKLDLPCYMAKENVLAYKKQHGLSLEEAARRVRYEFYYNTAKTNAFNKIALGHHQEDNAELILMHLFRGSGPLGISGIPPIRKLKENNIRIIRPFIELSKTQIIDFLRKNNIEYVTDKSNLEPSHLRNNIRNDLLPLLKTTYNPKIIETLNRLSSIVRSEEKWMDDIIVPLFEQMVTCLENGRIALCVSDLSQLTIAAQRRIIRKAIREIKGNIRRITFTHVDSIIALAKDGPNQSSLDFPDRIRALKDGNELLILQEIKPLRDLTNKENNTISSVYEYKIDNPLGDDPAGNNPVDNDPVRDVDNTDSSAIPGESFQNRKPKSIFIKEINAHLKFAEIRIHDLSDVKRTGQQSAFFDYDRLNFPLVLRNFMPGDRFTPMGMSGTQKVKKYFIDHKIPKNMRADIPVLLSNGKIIWVVGHRIDETVKVTSTTRNVLKAELFLA